MYSRRYDKTLFFAGFLTITSTKNAQGLQRRSKSTFDSLDPNTPLGMLHAPREGCVAPRVANDAESKNPWAQKPREALPSNNKERNILVLLRSIGTVLIIKCMRNMTKATMKSNSLKQDFAQGSCKNKTPFRTSSQSMDLIKKFLSEYDRVQV
ncbi:hypothetical protein ACJX0J_040399, partial [Zea mays]